jgi:hypothetical protein
VVIGRHRDRAAGVLLLVSALTPTYFAYVLNVPALVVGLYLLIAPRRASRPRLHGPDGVASRMAAESADTR